MFFVDATGFGPPGIAFGPDVFYVDSPVKLEKIAMVIRRLCKRFTNPHVLIDCINGLVDVNGPEPTIEYVHYLVNQSAQDGADIDLVVDATRGGWVNKLRHIVDGVVATEAA